MAGGDFARNPKGSSLALHASQKVIDKIKKQAPPSAKVSHKRYLVL